MQQTTASNPPSVRGNLDIPVIVDGKCYAVMSANFSFEGLEAVTRFIFGVACEVVVTVTGKTTIGDKWYDAGFIREFAAGAALEAVKPYLADGQKPEVKTGETGATLKCSVVVEQNIFVTMQRFAFGLGLSYSHAFNEAVAASPKRVVIDPPLPDRP